MLVTRDPDVTKPRALIASRGSCLTCPRKFYFGKLNRDSANLIHSNILLKFHLTFRRM